MPELPTNPEALSTLLNEIEEGKLQLPEFQRDFVWKPRQIESLLGSISKDYPTGSFLFLKYTSELLGIRNVSDATPPTAEPFRLILDGQQRLTALYQVFFAKGENRYFIKLEDAIDFESGVLKETEPDDIIDHFTKKKWENNYNTAEVQYKNGFLPLDVFIDGIKFGGWKRGYIKNRELDWENADSLFDTFDDRYGNVFRSYRYPVISIEEPHNTNIEAICRIFETINSTGTKLTVFDLMTASLFPVGIKLRDLWEETLNTYPYFREEDFNVDPVLILQIITLKRKGVTRRNHILNLKPREVRPNWVRELVKDWWQAADFLNKGLGFLINGCGALKKKWLSYEAMLPTLSMIIGQVMKLRGPAKAIALSKLKRWYWCSVFSRRYEKATDTQNEVDFRELTIWIFNEGPEPKAVNAYTNFEENLWNIKKHGDSIFRGVISLVLSKTPLDFHSCETITRELITNRIIDNHHLFPKNSDVVKNSDFNKKHVDSILNRALICEETDKQIGNKNPSIYIGEMEDSLGSGVLKDILLSHAIPENAIEALKKDDLKAFFEFRNEEIIAMITEATSEPNNP